MTFAQYQETFTEPLLSELKNIITTVNKKIINRSIKITWNYREKMIKDRHHITCGGHRNPIFEPMPKAYIQP